MQDIQDNTCVVEDGFIDSEGVLRLKKEVQALGRGEPVSVSPAGRKPMVVVSGGGWLRRGRQSPCQARIPDTERSPVVQLWSRPGGSGAACRVKPGRPGIPQFAGLVCAPWSASWTPEQVATSGWSTVILKLTLRHKTDLTSFSEFFH